MSCARVIAGVGLCCVIVITDTLGGCAPTPPYRRETYVVRPQDTLYSIAWRHDVDFRDLAKWNNIGPDYRLSVGQVLFLHPVGGSAAAPRSAAASRPAGGGPASGSKPSLSQPTTSTRPQSIPRGGKPKSSAATPGGSAASGGSAAGNAVGGTGTGTGTGAGVGIGPGTGTGPGVVAGGGAIQWLWPTEHSAPPRPVPGGGILLFGKLGQDVRAAGAGRVVYTGSGIRGYGNLIIVKHGDNLLSSYAHNSEMLVHEGQDVFVGQIIAHMGTAAHQTCALYFEIRLNGKPVDPLRYLPVAK